LPTTPLFAGSSVALLVAPNPDEELPAAVPEDVCPGEVPSAVLPLSLENEPPGPKAGALFVGSLVVVLVPKPVDDAPPAIEVEAAALPVGGAVTCGSAATVEDVFVVVLPEVFVLLVVTVLPLVPTAVVTRADVWAIAGAVPRARATEVAMRTLRMKISFSDPCPIGSAARSTGCDPA